MSLHLGLNVKCDNLLKNLDVLYLVHNKSLDIYET